MTQQDVWKAQGRRLRQARLKKGMGSASAAAELFGVKIGTYRNHERGTRSLARAAAAYAAALDVTPEWLLWGRDGGIGPLPEGKAAILEETRTVAVHIVSQAIGRLDGNASSIELPAGAPVDAKVLQIVGEGLRPTYDDGMILLYWNKEFQPRTAVGSNCAIALRGGPIVLARLEPGPRPESWALFNVNGTGLISYDTRIEWAAPIEIVLRSSRWHEVWPRNLSIGTDED